MKWVRTEKEWVAMETKCFIAVGVFSVELLLAYQVSMIYAVEWPDSSIYIFYVILGWVYDIISHLICIFYTFFNLSISETTKAEEGLPTSDFRLPTSDFRLPTSNFQLQTSDFRLPTLKFKASIFGGQLISPEMESNLIQSESYTAISKKVALVIHDAWSTFHSPQCIMGASLV